MHPSTKSVASVSITLFHSGYKCARIGAEVNLCLSCSMALFCSSSQNDKCFPPLVFNVSVIGLQTSEKVSMKRR